METIAEQTAEVET